MVTLVDFRGIARLPLRLVRRHARCRTTPPDLVLGEVVIHDLDRLRDPLQDHSCRIGYQMTGSSPSFRAAEPLNSVVSSTVTKGKEPP